MPVSSTVDPQVGRRLFWLAPLAVGTLVLLGQHAKTPPPDVPHVGLAAARTMVEGGALIVDVRSREAYAARHIADAISAPLDELSAAIPASIAAARDRPILVYCGDGSRLGPQATQLLNRAGYAKAMNLAPGLGGWADAGLPVVRAPG